LLAVRSGISVKNNINLVNAPGITDADYRGEVIVVLTKYAGPAYTIDRGDRIAQLVITPYLDMGVEEGKLSNTKRGSGGHGSTGR